MDFNQRYNQFNHSAIFFNFNTHKKIRNNNLITFVVCAVLLISIDNVLKIWLHKGTAFDLQNQKGAS